MLGKLRVRTKLPTTTGAVSTAAEILSFGEAVFGGPSGKPLPDGFDPADVDLLTLTDSNGTGRLAGSFADGGDLLSSGRLVNWRVEAGAADPGASGVVSFRAKRVGTKTRDAFLLYVGGLPASAAVTLVADGVAVGQFTTTAQGFLVIAEGPVPVPTSVAGRMLPVNALPASVDLDTLGALTLTDAGGQTSWRAAGCERREAGCGVAREAREARERQPSKLCHPERSESASAVEGPRNQYMPGLVCTPDQRRESAELRDVPPRRNACTNAEVLRLRYPPLRMTDL